jgi:uncharacterized protein YggU (UPF0235/DUF167 family)
VRLQVHVTPKSRAASIDASRADRTVRLRVTEAPEEGRANRAVIALLSERLGIPKSALAVVGGAAARRKWIEISGLEEAEVWRRLEAES